MQQCIKFILFWNDTLHVSDSLSVLHHEFKTVPIATGICQTDSGTCLTYACCCVYSLMDGKDRPIHAECHFKIKYILYIGVSG